jgi:hypothetical protein
MKSFPAALEQHLTALVPEQRAEALILAADYCLKVRLNSRDPGTLISMALLEPGDLPADACKSLYQSLESLYLQASKDKGSSAETRQIANRLGKQMESRGSVRLGGPDIRHREVSARTALSSRWI